MRPSCVFLSYSAIVNDIDLSRYDYLRNCGIQLKHMSNAECAGDAGIS